ncbi:MAG: AbrB/MazE/SpoVT family DNA-binding domain-containing protein [Rhizobiales bacterium]|nr:AbrB/MazE/SpoVT family DNA-binding domain-containing protein [Hyphomicrobiales bacterium]
MAQIVVSKWGNSSGIRLSKAMLDALGVRPGDVVNFTVEDGKAIIEPARPRNATLEWIISEMKRLGPENEPELVERGPIPTESIDDGYSRGEIAPDDVLKRR